MLFSSCISHPPIPLKISHFGQAGSLRHNVEVYRGFTSALKSTNEHFGQQARTGAGLLGDWSFAKGTRLVIKQKVSTFIHCRKRFGVQASWLASSQLASSVFTLGTAAVLPFYALMIFAPKAEMGKFCWNIFNSIFPCGDIDDRPLLVLNLSGVRSSDEPIVNCIIYLRFGGL
ncbi:hypothetical protein PTKIN_Ptkin12aG0054900 [Pterospermum kingtungense]